MIGRRLLRPRRSHRSWRRVLLLLVTGYILLDALLIATHNPPSTRVSPSSPLASPISRKIFIASTHRHNAHILRSHWNAAVLELVEYFGAENVFVSVYESGSLDDTKEALRELDRALEGQGVPRFVFLDERDQLEEVGGRPERQKPGWIWTRRGMYELRRIPYLANLRNEVMKQLYEQKEKGVTYDTVLWLNDVVFTTEDVITLLATRDGHYDSVCSLDFNVSSIYYDTFALRDISGQPAVPQTWPYFLSPASRSALISNLPVPVRSCWNGIIAMKSAPFYSRRQLRFRGISDDLAMHHLEGSECCLIHADNYVGDDDDGGGNEGVWLNPNVRVGYNEAAYRAVNPEDGRWPGTWERIRGVWRNRWARWGGVGWVRRMVERWRVRRKVRTWVEEVEEWGVMGVGRGEAGVHCLVNEMQVLYEGGWIHV